MKITVHYHHEGEGWWADAEEAPGFTAAAATFAEVRDQVRDGLAFHFDVDPDTIEIDATGVPVVSAWLAAQGTADQFDEIRRGVAERERSGDFSTAGSR
jgi:predicted RNase H-like HicB family nuclease